ncbi:hypothetical protein SCLCIDRAFT_144848, partial [Scleroderma citrinum Foug A]
AARHYKNSVKEILKLATGLFRACLVAQNIYPDQVMQITWAKEVWMEACEHLEIKITHNNDIIQLIMNHTWQLTSELKGKVCSLVKTMYGLENSCKNVDVMKNKHLVDDLKDQLGFCYKSLGDPARNILRQGLYKHHIIQKAVDILFYANKKDKGVLFPEYFSPFPLPGLGLILTVVFICHFSIKACLDEWANGVRVDMTFTQPAYEDIYKRHINHLKWFNTQTKEIQILSKLLKQLDVKGRLHAKVDTQPEEKQQIGLDEDAIQAAIQEFQSEDGVGLGGENSDDDN